MKGKPFSVINFRSKKIKRTNVIIVFWILNSLKIIHYSYPVEWIVREMVGNAAFLRAILERCVDTNPRDGQVSLRELFNGAAVNNDLI